MQESLETFGFTQRRTRLLLVRQDIWNTLKLIRHYRDKLEGLRRKEKELEAKLYEHKK